MPVFVRTSVSSTSSGFTPDVVVFTAGSATSARQLSNESRAAVAEYFSVYKGTDASGTVKRVNLTTPLHPSLKRAYDDVLVPYWKDVILPNQELLVEEKTRENALAMIPDPDTRERVASSWKGSDDSVARVGRNSRRLWRRRSRRTTRITP